MEKIIFEFKNILVTFTRSELDRWMPNGIGSSSINLSREDQQEAALDMLTMEGHIDDRVASLIEQMSIKNRAQLFRIECEEEYE